MTVRLVAFLRGINVGGRTVKKEILRVAFEIGFRSVTTYKQSGNIIFDSNSSNIWEVKDKIEEKLCVMLGFKVAVFIRTIPQLKNILELEPFKGQPQTDSSFLVTMLESPSSESLLPLPLTIPKSTAQIISASGTEVFSVTHGGGEGALPNPFIESKLKKKATTRNLNVIKEIVERTKT